MTKALWPHQEQAVKAIVAAVGGGGRCQAIAACGTGKTLIGAEVSREAAPAGRVLVTVPTLELLAQTASAWAAHLGSGAGLIGAACGENAVTIEAAEVRSEMEHLHAGVTTDPASLARWLGTGGRVTVFATYASLPVIASAHADHGAAAWDLAVIDEAHRTAGAAGSPWQAIHDDISIPAARRLYMTATPRVMTAPSDETTSMDDETVFGPEVFRLSFAEAIESGLLADYRVAVCVVTDQDVAALAARRSAVNAGGPVVPADMLAAQVALLKASTRWGLRRVITYHQRVLRAHRFAQTLANAVDLLPAGEKPPRLRASAVDGSMPLWQRRDILRHLGAPADRTVVVSNARVLSEGVDVPDLDAVMFADPRDSGTDIVQAVGRALRRGRSAAKVATIIVPVLLANGEAPEAALEGSEWDTLWRTVRALRAHDERLADWLDAGRARGSRDQERGTGTLPAWLDVTGIRVRPGFASALHVRIVESATSSWLGGLRHAREYHAGHGHLAVPLGYVTSGGFPLGRWVANCRQRARSFEAARIAELDTLGMIWDPREARWAEGISLAREWHRVHGHLRVPRGYVSPDGYRLGDWLHNAGAARRRGDLAPQRAAELAAAGFERQPHEERWAAGMRSARAFRDAHGHLQVAWSFSDESGFRLGQWLYNQRRKRRDRKLSPEREKELSDLGIEW